MLKTKLETIQVGSQKWATKNLASTTFRNGDPIPATPSANEARAQSLLKASLAENVKKGWEKE